MVPSSQDRTLEGMDVGCCSAVMLAMSDSPNQRVQAEHENAYFHEILYSDAVSFTKQPFKENRLCQTSKVFKHPIQAELIIEQLIFVYAWMLTGKQHSAFQRAYLWPLF